MKKGGFLLILSFMIIIPSAFSISLQDLIDFFNFDFLTEEINVTGQNDFMTDKNGNGINDTLIIELETDGDSGNYLVVVNLYDESVISNETKKTLVSGTNRFNISFPTELLTKNKLNYSISVYGEDFSLKYIKENIETENYANYEKGITIINISDNAVNSSLLLNLTINFTKSGVYEIITYLKYNDTIIFSKTNKTFGSVMDYAILSFDNGAIKDTHFAGKFNLTSIKINDRIIKVDYLTKNYDFRDFAQTSYFSSFSDYGIDTNNNGLYDFLRLNMTLEIKNNDSFGIEADLYDLFDNFIAKKEKTETLIIGNNNILLDFDGTAIYDKKLNGPFIPKSARLKRNGSAVDTVNGFHITQNYNYTNFEKPALPDLNITLELSDEHNYGINNFTFNVTISNMGNKNAFNVFLEIFDNKTFSRNETINILPENSSKKYSINLENISDFEISAIADFDDFVEESNESNNIAREIIKINKNPVLEQINNLTVNETERIAINITALDPNGDNLIYSINNSNFLKNDNLFSWRPTTKDAGNYTIRVNVSDGFLHDSKTFSIYVLDRKDIDLDDDGINDSLDRLIGDNKSINSSTINVSFFIGNSTNLSRVFEGKQKIEFKDENITIVEFDFNFSSIELNLNNVVINKQTGNSSGATIFTLRNTTLPEGFAKILYVDKLNASQNGICIKDEEIGSIEEISDNCDGPNEIRIECDGTLQSGYNCSYFNSTGKYKVAGLKNSGIKQLDYEKEETPSSSPGSSGGGGRKLACTEQWSCSEWSSCADNKQERTCADLSSCGTISNKPIESQECGMQLEQKEIDEREIKKAISDNEPIENELKNMLPRITGFFAANPGASPKIGTLIVFAVITLGLLMYFVIRIGNV